MNEALKAVSARSDAVCAQTCLAVQGELDISF